MSVAIWTGVTALTVIAALLADIARQLRFIAKNTREGLKK